MKFTDEDLKRLKETCDLMELTDNTVLNGTELKALLARLEAAELVIQSYRDLEKENASYDDTISLLNEWRKTKGDVRGDL